jgi:hypothetical protein
VALSVIQNALAAGVKATPHAFFRFEVLYRGSAWQIRDEIVDVAGILPIIGANRADA